jgi:hypothetical protein
MMSLKRFKRKMRNLRTQGERYKVEKQIRDAYAEYWPDSKKKKVSNIMIAVSVIAIVIYTVASFIIQYFTGIEVSSTLTTCYFSFFGGELLVLAGIKITKVRNEYGELYGNNSGE